MKLMSEIQTLMWKVRPLENSVWRLFNVNSFASRNNKCKRSSTIQCKVLLLSDRYFQFDAIGSTLEGKMMPHWIYQFINFPPSGLSVFDKINEISVKSCYNIFCQSINTSNILLNQRLMYFNEKQEFYV